MTKEEQEALDKKRSENAGDLTISGISSALGVALGTDPDGDGDEDWPWVVDVNLTKNTFVYCCDGQFYEQAFHIDGDSAELLGKPQQVQAKTTYEPVEMARMARFVEDDSVVFEGEIFGSGSYPEKGCEVGPADLVQMAIRFAGPLPIFDQHNDRSPFYRALHETDDDGPNRPQ